MVLYLFEIATTDSAWRDLSNEPNRDFLRCRFAEIFKKNDYIWSPYISLVLPFGTQESRILEPLNLNPYNFFTSEPIWAKFCTLILPSNF